MSRPMLAALAVAALALTACSSGASTTSAKFTTWYGKGGAQRITAISNDVKAMATAADATDMGSICRTLGTHVTAATAYGPIPDSEAQQHWTKVLDLFGKASKDCSDGFGQTNTDLMDRSQQELAAAQQETNLLQARLNALAAK